VKNITPKSLPQSATSLPEERIDSLAKLARIRLTSAEKKEIAGDLATMLNYVKTLDEVDTSHVKLTSHMSHYPGVAGVVSADSTRRNDDVKPGLSLEKALQNAPQQAGDHFAVPTVIE